jgi:hypothetical protein
MVEAFSVGATTVLFGNILAGGLFMLRDGVIENLGTNRVLIGLTGVLKY